MAELILDLVEGRQLSLRLEKGSIQVSHIVHKEEKAMEAKLGSIGREDCIHLQSFLKDSMPTMSTAKDELFNEWVFPIFEQIWRWYSAKMRINEPPPSEEE